MSDDPAQDAQAAGPADLPAPAANEAGADKPSLEQRFEALEAKVAALLERGVMKLHERLVEVERANGIRPADETGA